MKTPLFSVRKGERATFIRFEKVLRIIVLLFNRLLCSCCEKRKTERVVGILRKNSSICLTANLLPNHEKKLNLRKASIKGWLTILFFSIAFLCPCSCGLVEMISGRFVMVEQPFFVQSLARENYCRFRMLMYFATTILPISTSFFISHL